ncbi:hypothetical protein V6Z11_A01G136300 [Gossypium hirsutum]
MQFRSCNQDPTLSIPCYYSECHSRSLLAKCPLKIDLYGCTRWGYRGRYFSISYLPTISFFFSSPYSFFTIIPKENEHQ